ncbi:MAG: glycosyltransferase family 4 protein [Sulfuricurvum sp.]|jgi:glycosyltransferase involved in cell wall biosynthesis|uniref:glycosyltransferase family 4 protein n=1 Tax=Sulfuricurvum sp. TaxID=2025608 RepID=UPI0025CC6883|nr:glycosyltransferase family 4 protein [Sulfuricurvum sp.]MCK9373402.1 glycosyltransferase family 4 protein [Sulfuricurvum sp.]
MATKICELCLSPDLGGLELYMMRASRYLADEGDECISVINEKGKLKSYYENTPYRYFTLKRRKVLFSWLSARTLARIIDEEAIDILHLHWTKDIPVAVMAKLLSKRKPKVVQSRHMTMTRFKDDLYHRFLYKNVDLMLAVTHQVKRQIEKFIPAEIRPATEVLYIGAEQPAIIGTEERKKRREEWGLADSFTVGIVGRIEPQKGQYLVIDATEKLIHQGIDACALIVGHPMSEEYLQLLKKDVAMRGLTDRVLFTGFTREAQVIMQLCDVVVLATENETFGLVLIEAMMCGVCVCASDSGGPLEIIDEGVNGVLFKTFNSDDLADKLATLYRTEGLREYYAAEGKKKALAVFESEKQFKALKEALENVCASV